MKAMNRRLSSLEQRFGTAAPTAQELATREAVEAIRRRRCQRLGEPYEPICWENDDRRPRMGIAETIWACRLKRRAAGKGE